MGKKAEHSLVRFHGAYFCERSEMLVYEYYAEKYHENQMYGDI